jgi:uncharacterized protein YkwD
MSDRVTRRGLMAGAAAMAGHIISGGPARAGSYRDYAMALNSKPPNGAAFRPDLEALIASYANDYRASQGRRPLQAEDAFLLAARAHAADMMLHDFVGHRASTGHDFERRMLAFVDDVTRYPAMGENAARDSQKTPANAAKARRLFQQWVESRPHRKALVSRDYAFVSTGVIQRGNKIWAVQIFWAAPRQKGLFQ